jgi:hypothetical protein
MHRLISNYLKYLFGAEDKRTTTRPCGKAGVKPMQLPHDGFHGQRQAGV